MPEIEPPTTTYAEYWPASVLMPDGKIYRRVRAYLTDTGLHLFFTRPTDDLAPSYTAPIDFTLTPKPDIHARNVGVDVHVHASVSDGEDGGDAVSELVVLTPTGGCGCGATLRFWKPSWARDTSPWPVTA
jgi:hypothetical protein